MGRTHPASSGFSSSRRMRFRFEFLKMNGRIMVKLVNIVSDFNRYEHMLTYVK